MMHPPAHKSATAAQIIFPDWAEGLDVTGPAYPELEAYERFDWQEWEEAFYRNDGCRED